MPDDSLMPADWYEKGSHDMAVARIAINAGGPTDTIAVLLQQAAEKYLKGYLLSMGWQLKKTHDLRELIDRAEEYRHGFATYSDLARLLTALYIEDKYPTSPSAGYSHDEIATLFRQTEELIALIIKKAT